MNEDARTVWCGNLSEKVTEEVLYELFLQAAPLERVRIPTDKSGRKCNYGFVTVKHEMSVDYVVQLLNGTSLYDRRLNIQPRNANQNQNMMQQQNVVDLGNLMLMGAMLQMPYNCGPQPHNGGFRGDDPGVYKQRNKRQDHHNFGRQVRGNNYRNNRHNYNDRNRRQRYH